MIGHRVLHYKASPGLALSCIPHSQFHIIYHHTNKTFISMKYCSTHSGMGVRSLFHILCTDDSTEDGGESVIDLENADVGVVGVVDSERQRKRIENKNIQIIKNRNRENKAGTRHENSNGIKQADYWALKKTNTRLLAGIGAKHILIQPWPPNFVPLQSFLSTMMKGGWTISKQEIDLVQGYHYISCCLTLSTDPAAPGHSDTAAREERVAELANSETLCIQHNPLFMRCAAGDMSNLEKTHWLSYLDKQLSSLRKKRGGMLKRAGIGERGDGEGGEADAYNLAAVISLVDKHITDCT